MLVRYEVGIKPDASSFVDLYRASTLGAYRPLDDLDAVQQMIEHANLIVTAWEDDLLVGLARTLTDFSYIAYLADLVVRDSHQRRGLGKELMRDTRSHLGERTKIILWAAPEAEAYYPRAGFRSISSAWLLGPGDLLGSSEPSK
jgi:GNAT superfamily N-acetyltransferase